MQRTTACALRFAVGNRPELPLARLVDDALHSGMSPLLVATIVGHGSLRVIERVDSHLTTDDTYDAVVAMIAK